jgi:hypothetical protein
MCTFSCFQSEPSHRRHLHRRRIGSQQLFLIRTVVDIGELSMTCKVESSVRCELPMVRTEARIGQAAVAQKGAQLRHAILELEPVRKAPPLGWGQKWTHVKFLGVVFRT